MEFGESIAGPDLVLVLVAGDQVTAVNRVGGPKAVALRIASFAEPEPGIIIKVFGIAREWEQAGDAWPPLLAARLWSPARMESLPLNELTAFLTRLPENPDASGMSWQDLKLRKASTLERRRLILGRKKDGLSQAMRTSFAQVVVEDEEARNELATYAVLFSMSALGKKFFGAEAAVADFREMLGTLEREALVELLVG